MIISDVNAGIELGSPTTPNTPYIDFHSSGKGGDYDSRLIASGGDGALGSGTLQLSGTLKTTGAVSSPSLSLSRPHSSDADFAVLNATYVYDHAGNLPGGHVVFNTHVGSTLYGSGPNYLYNLFGEVAISSANVTGQMVGSGGQAVRWTSGPAQAWSGYFNCVDRTGLSSSHNGAMQGIEVDLAAVGADDGVQFPGGGNRVGISVALGQDSHVGDPAYKVYGASAVFATTLGGHEAAWKRVFQVAGVFSEAALDTRLAGQEAAAHAIWLGDGHSIALDQAGSVTVRFDPATSRVKIARGGRDVFSIDANGNVRAAGTITSNTTP